MAYGYVIKSSCYNICGSRCPADRIVRFENLVDCYFLDFFWDGYFMLAMTCAVKFRVPEALVESCTSCFMSKFWTRWLHL